MTVAPACLHCNCCNCWGVLSWPAQCHRSGPGQVTGPGHRGATNKTLLYAEYITRVFGFLRIGIFIDHWFLFNDWWLSSVGDSPFFKSNRVNSSMSDNFFLQLKKMRWNESGRYLYWLEVPLICPGMESRIALNTRVTNCSFVGKVSKCNQTRRTTAEWITGIFPISAAESYIAGLIFVIDSATWPDGWFMCAECVMQNV